MPLSGEKFLSQVKAILANELLYNTLESELPSEEPEKFVPCIEGIKKLRQIMNKIEKRDPSLQEKYKKEFEKFLIEEWDVDSQIAHFIYNEILKNAPPILEVEEEKNIDDDDISSLSIIKKALIAAVDKFPDKNITRWFSQHPFDLVRLSDEDCQKKLYLIQSLSTTVGNIRQNIPALQGKLKSEFNDFLTQLGATPEECDYFYEKISNNVTHDLRSEKAKNEILSYNHKENFEKRLSSFCEAVELLIQFIEEEENNSIEKKSLRENIAALYANSIQKIKNLNSINDRKAQLQHFIQKASRLLGDNSARLHRDGDVFKMVVLAEKYATWKNGRGELNTISEVDTGTVNKKLTVVQTEVPRSRWTERQRKELLSVLESSPPAWFLKLSRFERWYISKKAQAVKSGANINDQLLSIPAALRSVFGVANYSQHRLSIKVNASSELKEDKDVSEELNVIRPRSGILVPIDLMRSKDEQLILEITQCNIVQLIIAELTSRDYSQEVKDSQKPVPVLLQTLLSQGAWGKSHHDDEYGMVEYKNRAAQKITEYLQDIAKYKAELINIGFEITDNNQLAINGNVINVDIICTNIPIDIGRRFNSRPDVNSKIVAYAEKSKDKIVQQALIAYKYNRWAIVDKILFSSRRNYNLFKASLEQIIIERCGGISHGSCKSGKDRKGMETLHTDAMLIYYSLYKKLPDYYDSTEDREKFVNIFVDLYFTRHQHTIADQNAPGSNGIKNVGGYAGILPADIVKAIEKRMEDEIEFTEKYAGLNKIKNKKIKQKDTTQAVQEIKEEDQIKDDIKQQQNLIENLMAIEDLPEIIRDSLEDVGNNIEEDKFDEGFYKAYSLAYIHGIHDGIEEEWFIELKNQLGHYFKTHKNVNFSHREVISTAAVQSETQDFIFDYVFELAADKKTPQEEKTEESFNKKILPTIRFIGDMCYENKKNEKFQEKLFYFCLNAYRLGSEMEGVPVSKLTFSSWVTQLHKEIKDSKLLPDLRDNDTDEDVYKKIAKAASSSPKFVETVLDEAKESILCDDKNTATNALRFIQAMGTEVVKEWNVRLPDKINKNLFLATNNNEAKVEALFYAYQASNVLGKYGNIPLPKEDGFDLDAWKAKIGNYEIPNPKDDKESIETYQTPAESRENVAQLLSKKEALKALYTGSKKSAEQGNARKKLFNKLAGILADSKLNYTVPAGENDIRSESPEKCTIKMEKFLGSKYALRLCKEAAKEEENDARFRDGVFLKSLKYRSGRKWLKKVILWIIGPSGGGKSEIANEMLDIFSNENNKNIPKGTETTGNNIVAVDGGIEREVSQVRKMILHVLQIKGQTGISDLSEYTKTKVKKKIREAALIQPDLHIVYPDTLVGKRTKFAKYKERFGDSLLQILVSIKVSRITVYFQSIYRAWNKVFNKKPKIKMNNSDVGFESKAPGGFWSYFSGEFVKFFARRTFFDLYGDKTIYAEVEQGATFIKENKKTGDWIERTSTGGEGVRIEKRYFDEWKQYKKDLPAGVKLLSPFAWLEDQFKEYRKAQGIVEVDLDDKNLSVADLEKAKKERAQAKKQWLKQRDKANGYNPITIYDENNPYKDKNKPAKKEEKSDEVSPRLVPDVKPIVSSPSSNNSDEDNLLSPSSALSDEVENEQPGIWQRVQRSFSSFFTSKSDGSISSGSTPWWKFWSTAPKDDENQPLLSANNVASTAVPISLSTSPVAMIPGADITQARGKIIADYNNIRLELARLSVEVTEQEAKNATPDEWKKTFKQLKKLHEDLEAVQDAARSFDKKIPAADPNNVSVALVDIDNVKEKIRVLGAEVGRKEYNIPFGPRGPQDYYFYISEEEKNDIIKKADKIMSDDSSGLTSRLFDSVVKSPEFYEEYPTPSLALIEKFNNIFHAGDKLESKFADFMDIKKEIFGEFSQYTSPFTEDGTPHSAIAKFNPNSHVKLMEAVHQVLRFSQEFVHEKNGDLLPWINNLLGDQSIGSSGPVNRIEQIKALRGEGRIQNDFIVSIVSLLPAIFIRDKRVPDNVKEFCLLASMLVSRHMFLYTNCLKTLDAVAEKNKTENNLLLKDEIDKVVLAGKDLQKSLFLNNITHNPEFLTKIFEKVDKVLTNQDKLDELNQLRLMTDNLTRADALALKASLNQFINVVTLIIEENIRKAEELKKAAEEKRLAEERLLKTYAAMLEMIGRKTQFFNQNRAIREALRDGIKDPIGRFIPGLMDKAQKRFSADNNLVTTITAIRKHIADAQHDNIALSKDLKRSPVMNEKEFKQRYPELVSQVRIPSLRMDTGIVSTLPPKRFAVYRNENAKTAFVSRMTDRNYLEITATNFPEDSAPVIINGKQYPSKAMLKYAQEQLHIAIASTKDTIYIEENANNPMLTRAFLLVSIAEGLNVRERKASNAYTQDEIDAFLGNNPEYKPQFDHVKEMEKLATALDSNGMMTEAKEVRDKLSHTSDVPVEDLVKMLEKIEKNYIPPSAAPSA